MHLMKKYIFCLLLLFLLSKIVGAQNTFEGTIKDKNSDEPLVGVSVYIPLLKKGGVTDAKGVVSIPQIPDGEFAVEISYLGYEGLTLEYSFPLPDSVQGQSYHLSPSHEEMEEVVISSTRSTRTIEDIPTRVEFIAGEELAEKGNMKPGDIRMLLNESTGIQTQQTSATSYNSSIRIQ